MSRLTDADLRAAFRLRALGRPSQALRQRIRHSTRSAQQPRMAPAIHGAAPRRPNFAPLSAIAAVVAILILAPVVGGGLDGQRFQLTSDSGSRDQTAAAVNVTAIEDGENDGDEDDEGDDEDGIDEDDEGDEDDDGDDGDPKESADDN
jgi:hypothetical protein